MTFCPKQAFCIHWGAGVWIPGAHLPPSQVTPNPEELLLDHATPGRLCNKGAGSSSHIPTSQAYRQHTPLVTNCGGWSTLYIHRHGSQLSALSATYGERTTSTCTRGPDDNWPGSSSSTPFSFVPSEALVLRTVPE